MFDPIDIECPTCKRKLKLKLNEMTSGKTKKCNGCSTIIEFSGNGARDIQKSMNDFERQMKKLSRI